MDMFHNMSYANQTNVDPGAGFVERDTIGRALE